MRRKREVKVIGALMTTLVVICLGIAVQFLWTGPAYADPGEGGRFVVAAADEDGWIIEPEYVSYFGGQTIVDALLASDHEFVGLDNGFIRSIDGHSFNISYFYDGGEWDLTMPASAVGKALVFTYRNEGVYGDDEAYLDLAVKLAGYSEMDQEKKNFKAIKTAYENARKDMPVATASKATQLLTAITAAEDNYEEWLAETPCDITFNITKAGAAAQDAICIVKDESGYLKHQGTAGDIAQLRSGKYTFTIQKVMDQVEGEFTIETGEEAKTITAELPADEWFGSIGISATSNTNWKALPMDTSDDGHTLTLYVPDTFTAIYPRIAPGASINNNADKKSHRFYADVIQTDGTYYGDESKTSNARAWDSVSTSVTKILNKGLEGRDDARFKVVYKGEDGYTQRQFKNLNIVRTPTLKALTAAEPSGTMLSLVGEGTTSFTESVKEYEVTTIADRLSIAGLTTDTGRTFGTYSEGYSIQVNGQTQPENGSVTVSVDDGDVITVKAVADNGNEDVYSITVNKEDGASLILNKESEDVSTHLINSAGSRILPDSETATSAEYVVAPGEYTWVGTVEDYYHTSASITVPGSGTQANVATPIKEQLLKDLYVKAGTTKTSPIYPEAGDKAYNWEDHEYTYLVWDNCTNFNIYYEVAEKIKTKKGKLIRGSYPKASDGLPQTESIKSFTASIGATGNQASGLFVRTGEKNNSLVYRAEYTEDNVTYYQEYFLDTKRKPIAQNISLKSVASGKERTVAIEQKEPQGGDKGFDYLVNEYITTVPRGAQELLIKVDYSNINDPGNGRFIITAGESVEERSLTAGSATLTVPLDPSETIETVEVVLDTGDPANVTNTYSIEVNKTDPVIVEFAVTPEDHNLVLIDNVTGETMSKRDDGKFELMQGGSYRYTATAHGYVGQQVTDYVATENEVITIALEQAPKNDSINTDLEADWPLFRFDADNNGVTDYLTPVEAEKTTLYWASKVGEGYSSGATGCPIIVGDYLYTYAGKYIIKIDRYTGDVVDSKEMAGQSAFAINSPTYAEGMIFVALSGKVQAFNAETLESLWVYQDATGGQPNCPIAYHNGYIYTGFWNSETKPANFVCLSVTDEDPEQPDEAKVPSWTVEDNGFYWAGAYVGPGAYSQDNTYILVGTDDGDSGYDKGSGNLLSIDRKTGLIIDRYDGVCRGDIRSSICHENGKFYFTSKGGYFCSFQINEDGTFKNGVRKLLLSQDPNISHIPMSTSTPCIYNGRAYVGVSGRSHFETFGGHSITVIDLETFSIAYSVETPGYPQTSGLLTTAYDDGNGEVYVYFVDNMTPGPIRMIKDAPGQTEPANMGQHVTIVNGEEVTKDVAYALWTPFGQQTQYAICSPISDEHGNIYFKNDSAYMMMLGATIDRMEVIKQPTKTTYRVGEVFDPTGMKVKAYYSNGTSRDVTKYIAFRDEETPFTEEEVGIQQVDITYNLGEKMLMYQNRDGQAGQEYIPPTAVLNVTVVGEEDHIHEYGEPQYSWEEDNSKCTATVNCTSQDCDESDDKTLTETVDASVEEVASTCSSKGKKTYTAAFVGSRFEDQIKEVEMEIDPEAHDWDEWKTTVEATETSVGSEERVCKHDKTHVETKEIPMKDHTHQLSQVLEVEASCLEPGNIEHWICSEGDNPCGRVFADSEAEEELDKEKASDDGGIIIPAKGHDYHDVPGSAKAADCTRDGKEADKKCSRCDSVIQGKKISKHGHKWDKGKVTKKATEKAQGVRTYTCSVCKATRTETIPKLKPKSPPTGKVTILNTIANSAKKTNDVIWDKSKVKNATNYEVNWRTRGASKWASRTVGNVTRGTTTGLSIKGLYEIRVRPKNSAGSGAWSNTVYRYFHTTEAIRLVSGSKGSFTMSWKNNPDATGYQVMFTTNKNGSGAANNINTVGKGQTSFTKKGLKSGTTYYVQVRELKKVGNAAYVGNISCPLAIKVK